jgi:hypothetical protein
MRALYAALPCQPALLLSTPPHAQPDGEPRSLSIHAIKNLRKNNTVVRKLQLPNNSNATLIKSSIKIGRICLRQTGLSAPIWPLCGQIPLLSLARLTKTPSMAFLLAWSLRKA